MAKKDKAAKKDKKDKVAEENGAKVPKALGGVKIPKALRNLGSLDAVLASPLARQILADVLVAAAGAAAAALVKNRPSAGQVADAGVAVVDASANAASGTRDLVQTAAGAVAEVVTDAARQILPAALTGEDRTAPRPAAEGAGEALGRAARPEGGRRKRDPLNPAEP